MRITPATWGSGRTNVVARLCTRVEVIASTLFYLPIKEFIMYILPVKPYDYGLQLSDYFTLGEFIQSRTACSQNIVAQFVYRPEIVDNIRFLHDKLLLPLRQAIGAPITINSGYRCRALNSTVGGATNSLHLWGLAADITAGNRQSMLIEAARLFKFHEMIIHKTYIHISLKEWNNEQRFRDQR